MLYLASDHAGFDLKEKIKQYLKDSNTVFEDMGPFSYQESDDYPDYIIPAAKKVAEHPDNKGILLGGSGQGEAIAANKVPGIRCAVYYGGDKSILALSKEHNNANILSLGARFLTLEEALDSVHLWLSTQFTNEERHLRRIAKIISFEKA